MAATEELRRNPWLRLLPWAFGIAAFVIAANKFVGGYGDPGIYLDCAREFSQGGIDLFRARQSTGPWDYPHCAVLPFVALQQLGSDALVRWLYCVLLGIGTAVILGDIVAAMRPLGGLKWWQWIAFGVVPAVSGPELHPRTTEPVARARDPADPRFLRASLPTSIR